MGFYINGFNQKANNVINSAVAVAGSLGHTFIGSEHLLYGILSENECISRELLNAQKVTPQIIMDKMIETTGKGEEVSLSLNDLTPRTKRVIENAIYEARNLGHSYVSTEHILMSILRESGCFAVNYLTELGVDTKKLYVSIVKAITSATKANPMDLGSQASGGYGQGQGHGHGHGQNGKQTDSKEMPFTKDLTVAARDKQLDPVLGRDEEITRVIQILSRRTKNNPCLIGEPGVGKTAIAEGLATKIVEGTVPETIKDKRILTLDISGMLAGAKYRGDFEERVKNVIEQVKKDSSIILFIDEIHNIIGAGAAEGAIDAANILKPQLARGEIQIIGATTIDEYRKHIEKDAALERRFQPVMVNEPSEDVSIIILNGLKDRYEAHHKVKIQDEAIKAAVTLSKRYIGDRFLPDKAIDLIDEACSKVRLTAFTAPPNVKDIEERLQKLTNEKMEAINNQSFESAAKLRDEEKELLQKLEEQKQNWTKENEQMRLQVGVEDIAQVVSSWTGIPVKSLTQEESKKLLDLENILHEKIVGQDDAVTAVSKAIRRGRVGLKDPKRPTGSFLFLGPTGVGKTEVCKVVAQTLFGDVDAMVRLDMSEYMEKHSVSKIVGSPPGYVGFDQGGQLTEKIRRKPYSVLLLDEVEKAHPDVFNILLQILEDGVLTDSQGRKVDFKNTVIIMTSNIGADKIIQGRKNMGFAKTGEETLDDTATKKMVLDELKHHFRPEFLNRLDDIIVFSKLTRDDIKLIAKNMLKELSVRAKGLEVTVHFDDSAVDRLAEIGYDPIYGARPLRRAITSNIEDLFSEKLLEGEIKAGDEITFSVVDSVFTIVK